MPDPDALEAAWAVLDLAGAGGDDVVVRSGSSLLVRRANALARVRPSAERAVTERELAMAAVLEACDVPAVKALAGVGLVEVAGHVATCWEWVDAVRAATPGDLGFLARRLRSNTSGLDPTALVAFDPIGHVVAVVGDCGDEPDVCFVRERAEVLVGRFAEVAGHDPLGAAVVHGDLHSENVVVGPVGPLLVDLELGGWGPPSYDLVPAVVASRRYGVPTGDLDVFIRAAAVDPRGWDGFATLVDVYELWVTAWAVSVAHRREEWAAEAALRVATLRDGLERTWRLS